MKNYVFNSELEFRKYVILNSKDVCKLFVSDDILENFIYFYCIFSDKSIIAAKEVSRNNFSYYNKIYRQLSEELNLYIIPESKTLKLKK